MIPRDVGLALLGRQVTSATWDANGVLHLILDDQSTLDLNLEHTIYEPPHRFIPNPPAWPFCESCGALAVMDTAADGTVTARVLKPVPA